MRRNNRDGVEEDRWPLSKAAILAGYLWMIRMRQGLRWCGPKASTASTWLETQIAPYSVMNPISTQTRCSSHACAAWGWLGSRLAAIKIGNQ
jgi:hypothetical protein